ncbi:S8 family serine peptidase [Shewanella sp. CG12_big_fil_rev_8_21_14_0_65_47_15]|uniref:S8 family serine peptidase n=1 Tax=Shewanella sp. CG12_big_fil_rev_8_21_14_0_65_47_15 TaxID=1975537 RepID=UPI000CACDECB|nr:S8 family serine peptidase [Shewanella sp. CG12_big_fil_rev_8_21_14_0_65_47_15]PIW60714.1 MAG: peptidase S8 [Shewanella sp. CG12_big_fil_rev_8_21_14_0_65_47_15]
MTINRTTKIALSLSSLAIAISAGVQAAPQAPGFAAAMQAQTSPLPKRYIVKFKNAGAAVMSADNLQATNDAQANALSTSMNYQPQVAEISAQHSVLNKAQAKEMKRIGRSNSYSVKLDAKGIKALKSRADVEYVEEDMPRHLLSESTPWGQTFVGATQLSDSQAGNRTICIIDSGYDRGHSELGGNNVTGTNNSGTGNWFEPGNNNAHGTHVAGTIAAIANNDGVIGVMPNQNANIHVVKVFNESGWGYSSSLVAAVDTCVANGANVVTMSLGGSGSSTTERNALAAHYNNGVLLIAAAGNAGDSTHSYPASYDGVMSVASVDNHKDHSAFSQYTNQVEVSGPGEAILSTVTRGEGRLADITIGGQSYFDSGVVPHNRLISSGGNYVPAPYNGTATATLAECSVSGSTFNCGNMTNKICLVERVGNQGTSYPEINAAKACKSAGASAAIVYSNVALPGLQNPFLVDANNEINMVSVSVDRATGLALRNQLGATVTVSNQGNKDYEYYNGTSMATPHVSGVATLVWSYHPECSAAQVRNALKMTAEDLGTAGRDNYYGYGLVNAVAAKTFLDASCDGPTDPVDPTPTDGVLVNGVAKTGLTGGASEELHFSFDVPQGATNLGFVMNGGTGDADLYVQYGAAPTTSNYDCRPYKGGNSESCPITNVQSGTYYAMLKGYSAFSGVSLTASYTASTGGGTPPTEPSSYSNTDNYNIPDNKTAGITSPITVTRSGDSGTVTAVVNIVHPYIGDLKVQLVSPTGQITTLHSNSGGSADNINKSYTVDMTGVESSGVWMLKAIDSASSDVGYIDSWELKFQ